MECPHCLVTIHPHFNQAGAFENGNTKIYWEPHWAICPACYETIIELRTFNLGEANGRSFRGNYREATLVYPKYRRRKEIPQSVPPEFAADYKEALAVLPLSPQASAALSRRILQHLLREKGGASQKDLAVQIEHVLKLGALPTHIAEDIDAIRNVGNFAAHPMKSQSTGEILPVEPGEAEWNLHTIESLFDFYFEQPARAKERRDKLNQKLQDVGKPDMKQP